MAEIKPFAALRFDTRLAGDIKNLVCPPYDVIDDPTRSALLEKSCYNMVKLELPQGSRPYCSAADTLNKWLSDGILRQDMDEGIYILDETFSDINGQTKTRRSLLCLVKLEEPETGIVLPHENTLAEAKEDRFQLLCATGCNLSPVFALYSDRNATTARRLDYLSKTCPPRYDFTTDSVHQRLWVINDPIAINAIRDDFTDRKLFIADGHHRYETALKYRSLKRANGDYCPGAEYIMMALTAMDDPGLTVYPTHRVVRFTADFNSDKLLSQCSKHFCITPAANRIETETAIAHCHNEGKCTFGYYDGTRWCVLTLKAPNAADNLDIATLHEVILKPLLDIDSDSTMLFYTRSSEEAEKAVSTGESCCFLLNPTRISDLAAAASNGEILPQKSTYFYPKPACGLVINKVE